MLEIARKIGAGKQHMQRLFFRLLLQPVKRLLTAHLLQTTAGGKGRAKIAEGLPYLVDSAILQGATSQNLRLSFGILAAQDMQRVFIHMAGDSHIAAIIAIVLINDDQIRHLHDAFFNPLQIVTAAGDL